MSDAYYQLLDATIQHLTELKARGVRFVPVSPETLAGLRTAGPQTTAPQRPPVRALAPQPALPQKPPVIPVAIQPIPIAQATLLPAPGQEAVAAPKPDLSPEAKAAAFGELRQRAMVCVKCPHLAAARKNVVFGVGDINAQLMFVGEAPGADEDEQGEPFVGRAGQLLTKIIQTMGYARQDVYICNILKCRPPGNRNPEPDEIEKCEPFLKRQLAALRPRVIVALGKFAAQCLLRDDTPISRLRGTFRSYEGITLMPTFHPAYLLRDPTKKKEAWADLKAVNAALKRLGLEPPRVAAGS